MLTRPLDLQHGDLVHLLHALICGKAFAFCIEISVSRIITAMLRQRKGRIDGDCSACVQYVACCFEKTSAGNKYVVAVAKCSAIIGREGREGEEMKREGTAK